MVYPIIPTASFSTREQEKPQDNPHEGGEKQVATKGIAQGSIISTSLKWSKNTSSHLR